MANDSHHVRGAIHERDLIGPARRPQHTKFLTRPDGRDPMMRFQGQNILRWKY